MKTLRIALSTALFLALSAPQAPAQRRSGSIYDPHQGPFGLVSEKTAFRKGDIVNVIIRENQTVKNQEAADLSKSTNLNYKINLFSVKPNTFGSPLPAVDADSADGFIGSAKYEKTGNFQARLAAIVIDTLPNGNLVISGRREIHVDNETKIIEFTGIVRRWDIRADNSVESELVANAEVVYRGTGPMTNTTNRRGLGGWVHGAISWLWPF